MKFFDAPAGLSSLSIGLGFAWVMIAAEWRHEWGRKTFEGKWFKFQIVAALVATLLCAWFWWRYLH